MSRSMASGIANKNYAGAPEGGRQGNHNMFDIFGRAVAGNTVSPEPLFSDANASEARRANAWLDDRLKRARALPVGQLLSETVTITPAMAEIILARCNSGNRALRERRVYGWAKAISEGRWKFSSQGISFSRDGDLNNGQHRLHGIIIAGKSVVMYVSFGEDRDVFDVLDTGAVRSGSDSLHTAGYKNTAVLAASARLLSNVTSDRPSANDSIPNDRVMEVVAAHPRLEEFTTKGSTIGKRLGFSCSAATVAFYLIASKSKHTDSLDSFIELLRVGNLANKRDPILVLREGLRGEALNGPTRSSNLHIVAHCAAIIIAWNRWIKGRSATTTNLRWSGGEFPVAE